MTAILVMDDEPALRNIVCNMLKPLGCALFPAEDGRQAIETARREHLDVAVLDMRVPDMDGLEVLAELRRIHPALRCIVVSGFGDAETAAAARELGAVAYISKPFRIDEVLAAVRTAAGVPLGSPPSVAPPERAAPVVPSPVVKSKAGVSRWVIGLGIALVALALGIAFRSSGSVREALTAVPIPSANPAGLCAGPRDLWVADWASGTLYTHARDAHLTVRGAVRTANARPSGIAFDGTDLWTSDPVERAIYRHAANASLSVVATFSSPAAHPSGLFCDGRSLWVLDSAAGKIYRHARDASLSVTGVYVSPAAAPCGMFRAGDTFYIGDARTNRVYAVSAKDLSPQHVYEIPAVGSQGTLAGIAGDASTVWVVFDGIGAVYMFPLQALKQTAV